MTSKRKFLKISVNCHPTLEEAICNLLFENSALGLEVEETEERFRAIHGFFAGSKNIKAVRNRFEALVQNLQRIFPEIPKPRCEVALFSDRDWQEKWKGDFKPLKISPDLIVQPSWWESQEPLRSGGVILKIDPKTAFGTGHHSSTKLCLLALREVVKPKDKVLDYGCGSGILGIYAAKKGASEVLGVDNNPEAVDCAKENVVINEVAKTVKIRIRPKSVKRGYYDIAVANIDLATLTQLITRIVGAVKPGGLLLFSGLLSEESSSIRKLLRTVGARALKTYQEGEWIAILGVTRVRRV
ncbi:MAG: 50S ribosomal protein L11 methyltransferase [Candidatus Zixiibacteriota bacterium]